MKGSQDWGLRVRELLLALAFIALLTAIILK
jgi:hypothetical protein